MLIDGLGRLIESLSSGVNIGDCETLFPYVHHTVAMSSETCPEAVLQHAFHILTVCCGWSHVYMLWLKDWCATSDAKAILLMLYSQEIHKF